VPRNARGEVRSKSLEGGSGNEPWSHCGGGILPPFHGVAIVEPNKQEETYPETASLKTQHAEGSPYRYELRLEGQNGGA